MTEPTDLLLRLYRAAREQPVDAFQDCALRLVKPLLQFDSCFWGTGTLLNQGIAVHIAHLHGMPFEYLEEYQALSPNDKVIPAVLAEPGEPKVFHSPTLFAGRQGAALLAFTRRAGWQNSMVTAFADFPHHIAQWISLYRPDPNHTYSAKEQGLAKVLVPHLVEALTINRAMHAATLYGTRSERNEALALCDRRGLVHQSSTDFDSLLSVEWPGWGGRRLPGQVVSKLLSNASRCYSGTLIRIDARIGGEFVSVRARRISPVDRLSSRELEVARLYSGGCSHKEVARELNIAPATVRQHISAVYTKLGVHDKAQLATLIARC